MSVDHGNIAMVILAKILLTYRNSQGISYEKNWLKKVMQSVSTTSKCCTLRGKESSINGLNEFL